MISLATGVAFAAGLVVFAFAFGGYEFTGGGLSTLLVPVWTVIGLVLLGGVPVYLLLRYSLVLPFVILLLTLFVAVRAELRPTPGEPLNVLFVAWVVPLAIALVLGGLEYAGRTYLGTYPPK